MDRYGAPCHGKWKKSDWMFLVGARCVKAQNVDLTWSPYNSAEHLSGQQVMGVQDGHRHA